MSLSSGVKLGVYEILAPYRDLVHNQGVEGRAIPPVSFVSLIRARQIDTTGFRETIRECQHTTVAPDLLVREREISLTTTREVEFSTVTTAMAGYKFLSVIRVEPR